MKVVILAAGEGSRLRPLTLSTPKPLIEVRGKPIIEHIIESLPDEINEVIMVVDYLQEKIKGHLGQVFLGKKIFYVKQGERKGTLGALWSAQGLLNENERFLVLNGDDLHDKAELEHFLRYERAFGVQKAIMPNYYYVESDENGNLSGFRKQTSEEQMSGGLIATGAYVIDTKIFEHPGIMVGGGEYGLPQTIHAQTEMTKSKLVETTGWMPINSIDDLNVANLNFRHL